MTTIAIIFSVPLTQRTVLNIDLGADSCGLHIAENGSIKPEKRYGYGGKYEYLQTFYTLAINQVLFTFMRYQ